MNTWIHERATAYEHAVAYALVIVLTLGCMLMFRSYTHAGVTDPSGNADPTTTVNSARGLLDVFTSGVDFGKAIGALGEAIKGLWDDCTGFGKAAKSAPEALKNAAKDPMKALKNGRELVKTGGGIGGDASKVLDKMEDAKRAGQGVGRAYQLRYDPNKVIILP